MPYIKQKDKARLSVPGSRPANAGELNFLITDICNEYRSTYQGYQCINDIIGALEGAKLEFYRRIAAPYEDKKCEENGDVYVQN